MSVSITLESVRGPIEVEIHRGGTISGEDLLDVVEHDQLSMELGGKGSQLVEFVEKFIEDPIKAILAESGLSLHDLVYLAADFAEHVLLIHENKYKDDFRPRNAIQAARDFVDGKIKLSTLKSHEKASRAAEVVRVGWAAAETAGAARGTRWADAARDAAYSAAWAVYSAAWNASDNKCSTEWQAARNAEVAWQVRRFVDCMEAVQAGKDWPDLKDTK